MHSWSLADKLKYTSKRVSKAKRSEIVAKLNKGLKT